jgi:hypothetical protein
MINVGVLFLRCFRMRRAGAVMAEAEAVSLLGSLLAGNGVRSKGDKSAPHNQGSVSLVLLRSPAFALRVTVVLGRVCLSTSHLLKIDRLRAVVGTEVFGSPTYSSLLRFR